LPKLFQTKISKICSAVFLRIGTYIMCAKFRENQTETVGGVAIWKTFDDIQTDR